MAKANTAVDISNEEVLRKFHSLMEVAEGKRAKKDMRSAMRSPLNEIRKNAQKGAKAVIVHRSSKVKPNLTAKGLSPLLKRGIELKVNKSGLGGRVMITKADYYPEYGFTTRGGKKVGKPIGLFWWELGTKTTIGRDKRLHKGTPKRPFFKMSVEQSLNEVNSKLINGIAKVIDKEARR